MFGAVTSSEFEISLMGDLALSPFYEPVAKLAREFTPELRFCKSFLGCPLFTILIVSDKEL